MSNKNANFLMMPSYTTLGQTRQDILIMRTYQTSMLKLHEISSACLLLTIFLASDSLFVNLT